MKGGSVPAGQGVRPYRPEDRERVRRICCDTGFLGRPIDPIFRDRDLFADLMTGPYLDHEPQWAWVAEQEGKVVGYLLGSVHPGFARRQLADGSRTFLRMLGRLAAGRYADHPRSRRFIRWLLLSAARERPRHPEGAAHLHFNLEQGHRGLLGFLLWRSFAARLEEAGIRRLYGEFYSWAARRPEQVYTRYGFRLFDRCETTLFRPEMTEPVHLVCVLREAASSPEHRS